MSPGKKANASICSFSDRDRQQLNKIYEIVNLLRNKIQDLKEELNGTKTELKEVKCENKIFKQAVNL